jgi:hypothetical protein
MGADDRIAAVCPDLGINAKRAHNLRREPAPTQGARMRSERDACAPAVGTRPARQMSAARRASRARVREALHAWHQRCGTRRSSFDWSRTTGAAAAAWRLSAWQKGDWRPVGTVTVLYDTSAEAQPDAFAR